MNARNVSQQMNVKDHIIPRLDVLLAVLNILLIVIAFIGNILMIVAVTRLLKKRLPSNIFILGLVVSDLALCIFQLPLVISSLLSERSPPLISSNGSSSGSVSLTGVIACNTSGIVYFTVRQVSFFAIMAIALDRYAALHFALKYKQYLTYMRGVVIIVLSYLISAAISIIPYLYDSTYVYNPIFLLCMWEIKRVYALKQCIYFIFVPTFVISNLVLGLSSIANVRKLQNMASKSRSNTSRPSSRVDSLDRASRTALIVVLAFTLCYLPRYILVFFVGIDVTQFWFYYMSVSEMIIYINSAINPLIYIFRSKQFINEISVLLHLRTEDTNLTNNGKLYQTVPLGNFSERTSRLLSLPRNKLERSFIFSSHAKLQDEEHEQSPGKPRVKVIRVNNDNNNNDYEKL